MKVYSPVSIICCPRPNLIWPSRTLQILNPQSAVLTNAEVLHYLQTRPLREPDRKTGSYIPTSRAGHATIRRDLLTYFREVTPWTTTLAKKFQNENYLNPEETAKIYGEQDSWLRVLLQRLAKYELAKGEVVMILNLGLGLEDWKGRMPPRLRDGGDGVTSAEEQRVSDEWVLAAVCEELEQRFGAEEIQAILGTVAEVLGAEKGKAEDGDRSGTVANQAHRMVSEWRAKAGMRGADESGDVEMDTAAEEEQPWEKWWL
jgi:hypothetical protein